MGNCSGRRYKLDGKSRIRSSQDSFVRIKVESEHEPENDSTNAEFDLKNGIVHLYEEDDDPEDKEEARRLHTAVNSVDIGKYQFPFENLVFEGGGNKGLAYCGAIKVLEDLGMMTQIKRYAGSSAGAMIAALLAVGYKADEIKGFLSQDLSKIFLDHSCGYLSLLPNLLTRFGWNPGKRIFKWFGEQLAKKTGNPDITFYELYKNQDFKKELCIVVTNLNTMNTEYCHPKTTPDMPIRAAARMSMAIPGLFQATDMEAYGQRNFYVDGGVLCNYPINCFDGWWLSMDMSDSFLERLQPLKDLSKLCEKKKRFGTFNEKTLGFLLYADDEPDVLRADLEMRIGTELPNFPNTKLGQAKLKKKKMQDKAKVEHSLTSHAVNAFMKVLKKHKRNKDDIIDRNELENTLNDVVMLPRAYPDAIITDLAQRKIKRTPRWKKEGTLPSCYIERLFGRDITVEEAFDVLDENKDGKISFHELVQFIERTSISLQNHFLGYQRKEITGIFSFFNTLQSALLTNVTINVVEVKDIERTVGINTGHVGTVDFILEEEDRRYVVEQGRRSTESFLRYYVVLKKPPLKGENSSGVNIS